LQDAQKASSDTLRNFYWGQGSRSNKLLQQRLERIQNAVPLVEDTGVMSSYVLRMRLTVEELERATRTVKAYDSQIATTFAAYKWIRVLWRCWQDHTIYREDHYLAALRKAGSPIIAWMEKNPPITRVKKTKTTKAK
jgi:hypothetical protein